MWRYLNEEAEAKHALRQPDARRSVCGLSLPSHQPDARWYGDRGAWEVQWLAALPECRQCRRILSPQPRPLKPGVVTVEQVRAFMRATLGVSDGRGR